VIVAGVFFFVAKTMSSHKNPIAFLNRAIGKSDKTKEFKSGNPVDSRASGRDHFLLFRIPPDRACTRARGTFKDLFGVKMGRERARAIERISL